MILTAHIMWYRQTIHRCVLAGVLATTTSCAEESDSPTGTASPTLDTVEQPVNAESPFSERVEERERMVTRQLVTRGIDHPGVLRAMRRVPRHAFVPKELQNRAYIDGPLPIGHDQTISQPYMVALMTQLVAPQQGTKALDVGTGSGYQAAVLAELVDQVFSIEILKPLADEAKQRLRELGYQNISFRIGDGYQGWPDEAPFDVIIVAAAPDHVPQPLVDQLAVGGKMVIPVGTRFQELLVLEKRQGGDVDRKYVAGVVFVPMTGEAQQRTAESP